MTGAVGGQTSLYILVLLSDLQDHMEMPMTSIILCGCWNRVGVWDFSLVRVHLIHLLSEFTSTSFPEFTPPGAS
ncbi:hypothetical protein CRUP_013223 [Coryphaenoides rupestris]|nr:hypothetical protein CRUP_013223 [Coryphaenoides rupestris]